LVGGTGVEPVTYGL